MKNSRLIVLGLLLLVSCNLDSLLSHRPRVVLDSLEQMDVSEHPGEVQSYYNLLLTILSFANFYTVNQD